MGTAVVLQVEQGEQLPCSPPHCDPRPRQPLPHLPHTWWPFISSPHGPGPDCCLCYLNHFPHSLQLTPSHPSHSAAGLGEVGGFPGSHTHPHPTPWVDESCSRLPAPPDVRHAASLLDKEVVILHPSFLLSVCPVPKMPSEP